MAARVGWGRLAASRCFCEAYRPGRHKPEERKATQKEAKYIYNLHPLSVWCGSTVCVGRKMGSAVRSIHVWILSEQARLLELECDFFPLASPFPHLGKRLSGSPHTVAVDAFLKQGLLSTCSRVGNEPSSYMGFICSPLIMRQI